MWHSMFVSGVPLLERVLRALLVYGFLLVAIRVVGRRELGQMTSFDIVVLLTISNMLQNAMIGNDSSITGAALGASVLITANLGVAYVVFRSRRAERIVEGTPKILVRDGKLDMQALRSELLTQQDLLSAVRNQGLDGFDDVHLAISEPNGQISVIPRRR